MRRIRSALGAGRRAITGVVRPIGRVVGDVVGALRPAPDTTEASVYFGLVLLGVGIETGHASLVVPGAVITFLGSAPVIARLRSGD